MPPHLGRIAMAIITTMVVEGGVLLRIPPKNVGITTTTTIRTIITMIPTIHNNNINNTFPSTNPMSFPKSRQIP